MQKQLRARDIKLVPIGNSKGIRIPKVLLQKHCFGDSLLLEETEQGLLLRKKMMTKVPGKKGGIGVRATYLTKS